MALSLAASLAAGCHSPQISSMISAQAAPKSPFKSGQEIEPHIRWFDVNLKRGAGREGQDHLWVYVPSHKKNAKLPCVFVAPAGTPLFYGAPLSEHDRAEHLPYARVGFVVVAYALDGPFFGPDLAGRSMDESLKSSVIAFRDSQSGLLNARVALNYALAHLPVDPRRLYVAGLSSGGTVALHVAEHEPRIAACAVFAPACDLEQQMEGGDKIIEQQLPDYQNFINASSPLLNSAKLKCPVFLFHADDDNVVEVSDNIKFAHKLSQTNHKLTFVRVPSGGHYESAIRQGIPQAVRWLQSQPR